MPAISCSFYSTSRPIRSSHVPSLVCPHPEHLSATRLPAFNPAVHILRHRACRFLVSIDPQEAEALPFSLTAHVASSRADHTRSCAPGTRGRARWQQPAASVDSGEGFPANPNLPDLLEHVNSPISSPATPQVPPHASALRFCRGLAFPAMEPLCS